MQEFRVDRLKAPVTLKLDDRLEVHGQVFVAPDPGDVPTVNKIRQLLNGPGAFFPIEVEEEASIVQNKDRIVWCRYEGPIGPVVEILIPRRRVTMVLADGSTVCGDLVADGPPDRRRVLDCLNLADRFVLVEARDADYLVRKDAITFVPSAEEGDPREEDAFEMQAAEEELASV